MIKGLTIFFKNYKYFAWVTMLVFVLFFILQMINGRDGMADFRVYYEATRALIFGEQVYHVPFGTEQGVYSGYYKYSPSALLPFIPLALLPYKLASSIFYFLIVLVFYYISKSLLERYGGGLALKQSRLLLILASICVSDHLIRELHLGNVNLMLLLLFLGIWRLIEEDKRMLAGILLGIGWMVKPHFMILLPFFFLKMEFKVLMWSFLSVVALLLFPILFLGYDANFDLFQDWIMTMNEHNSSISESPNTIYGLIQNGVLSLFSINGGMLLVFIVLLVVGMSVLALWGHSLKNARSFGFIYFLLIALIPNLSHTDTEHFLWSLPLLYICMLDLIKNYKLWKALLLLIAAVPYSFNTPDLLGKNISIFLDHGGIGLANLIFIVYAVLVYLKSKDEDKRWRTTPN